MRGHSPSYYSPPRRGYYGGGGRERSPPRRRYGGGGSNREASQSLLVRNIPLNCRPDDLRIPFERYGRVRDVYLPRDYYSGDPRGFAFVEFVDPNDAAEAQYHMNRQRFGGREITVVVASETRKKPDDMRHRARVSGPSRHGSHHRSSGYGRSRSRSRSPNYRPSSRTRHTSRSYSPPPRRHSEGRRSPRDYPEGRNEEFKRVSHSPGYRGASNGQADKDTYDDVDERRRSYSRSRSPVPKRVSRSPSGSRSRSADLSPGH